MESAIRKHGNVDIKWSAQGMLRLTQEGMRRLFVPTILKIKEAVGTVMLAQDTSGSSCLLSDLHLSWQLRSSRNVTECIFVSNLQKTVI